MDTYEVISVNGNDVNAVHEFQAESFDAAIEMAKNSHDFQMDANETDDIYARRLPK